MKISQPSIRPAVPRQGPRTRHDDIHNDIKAARFLFRGVGRRPPPPRVSAGHPAVQRARPAGLFAEGMKRRRYGYITAMYA
jgi:hypothetical protein